MSQAAVLCPRCGETAARLTVKYSLPNLGRSYHKCLPCEKWLCWDEADDVTNTVPFPQQQSSQRATPKPTTSVPPTPSKAASPSKAPPAKGFEPTTPEKQAPPQTHSSPSPSPPAGMPQPPAPSPGPGPAPSSHPSSAAGTGPATHFGRSGNNAGASTNGTNAGSKQQDPQASSKRKLEVDFAAVQSENKRMKAEIDKLQKQLDHSNAKATGLKAQADTVRSLLDQQKDETNRLRSKVHLQQAQAKMYEDIVTQLTEEVNRYRAQEQAEAQDFDRKKQQWHSWSQQHPHRPRSQPSGAGPSSGHHSRPQERSSDSHTHDDRSQPKHGHNPCPGYEDNIFAFSEVPALTDLTSIKSLKHFLCQAGADAASRCCNEKAELLALAKEKVNSWEVRRIVQCSKLVQPMNYAAVFRNPKDCSTVHKLYRELSLKVHPDKNQGDELATPAFQFLQQAYLRMGPKAQRL